MPKSEFQATDCVFFNWEKQICNVFEDGKTRCFGCSFRKTKADKARSKEKVKKRLNSLPEDQKQYIRDKYPMSSYSFDPEKKRKEWTEEDDKILLRLIQSGERDAEKIAKEMDKNENTVRYRMRYLGNIGLCEKNTCPKATKWTPDMKEKVLQMIELGYTNDGVANKLGIKKTALNSALRRIYGTSNFQKIKGLKA